MSERQSLNQLLQWSIENSEASRNSNAQPTDQQRDPGRGLNPEILAQLMGGPSDADLMRQSMTAILSPEVDMENKSVAWDNLEQLIESIDNANNMESLGLWQPLLSQLESSEADNRRMACWCLSTAVQNNIKCQEKLTSLDGISKLAKLATQDADQSVRKKAINALSSAVRNYQPGLDDLERCLPDHVWRRKPGGLEAGEMDSVDEVIGKLREGVVNAG